MSKISLARFVVYPLQGSTGLTICLATVFLVMHILAFAGTLFFVPDELRTFSAAMTPAYAGAACILFLFAIAESAILKRVEERAEVFAWDHNILRSTCAFLCFAALLLALLSRSWLYGPP